MKRASLAIIAVVVLLVEISSAQGPQGRGYNRPTSADDKIEHVSALQLIANPQAFDHKRVQLIGFLNLQFEETQSVYIVKIGTLEF